MEDLTKLREAVAKATPTENQRPANGWPAPVVLMDGTEVGADHSIRWFDADIRRYRCQLEVDGKLYQGVRTKDKKYKLL